MFCVLSVCFVVEYTIAGRMDVPNELSKGEKPPVYGLGLPVIVRVRCIDNGLGLYLLPTTAGHSARPMIVYAYHTWGGIRGSRP